MQYFSNGFVFFFVVFVCVCHSANKFYYNKKNKRKAGANKLRWEKQFKEARKKRNQFLRFVLSILIIIAVLLFAGCKIENWAKKKCHWSRNGVCWFRCNKIQLHDSKKKSSDAILIKDTWVTQLRKFNGLKTTKKKCDFWWGGVNKVCFRIFDYSNWDMQTSNEAQ